jgi:hypothetical protein
MTRQSKTSGFRVKKIRNDKTEFKLGSKQIEEAAEHLLEVVNLIRKANENRSSNKLKEPDLFMIIAGGEEAYTRKDGIKIIPIGCLKN